MLGFERENILINCTIKSPFPINYGSQVAYWRQIYCHSDTFQERAFFCSTHIEGAQVTVSFVWRLRHSPSDPHRRAAAATITAQRLFSRCFSSDSGFRLKSEAHSN